jgi:hypothetical protein
MYHKRGSQTGPSAVSESVSVSPGILKPEPVREMMETVEQFQQIIDQRQEALDSLSAD